MTRTANSHSNSGGGAATPPKSANNRTLQIPTGSFVRYLKLFFGHQGFGGILSVVGMFLSSLLNCLGILSLLPLLQFTGIDNEGFAGSVQAFLAEVGIGLSIGSVLFSFVCLYIMQAAMLRTLNLHNASVERSFTRSLEQRLYASIMLCEWTFFLKNRNSDLMYSLTQNVQRVATGTMSLLRMMSTVAMTTVQVGLCVMISPLVSLGLLASSAAFWLVFARHNQKIHGRGRELIQLRKQQYGNVTDYLAGMKEARSACAEQQQIAAFQNTSNAMKESQLSYNRTQENTAFLWKLGTIAMLSMLLYVSVQIMGVPIVEVMLLTAIAGRLLPRLQTLQTSLQQVLHMLPAFESLMDLLQRCEAAQEVQSREQTVASDQTNSLSPEQQTISLEAEIRIQDLSFSYDPSSSRMALDSVHLSIPVGTTVAFVGPSGAGKTTLADVLMGLLPPSQGSILVNGRPLKGEDLRPWRRGIGYVPQETFLLHDTLRANLCWSNPDATDEELKAALKLAAAEKFVDALPDGLQTVLGDRGVRLSGGERQRIALARALVRKPKLLILDEATSALDGENQLAIQQAVSKLHGEMTIVIIAHRLSSVRDADQIVVLDGGRIVEVGSYASLLKISGGRFQSMVQNEHARAA